MTVHEAIKIYVVQEYLTMLVHAYAILLNRKSRFQIYIYI